MDISKIFRALAATLSVYAAPVLAEPVRETYLECVARAQNTEMHSNPGDPRGGGQTIIGNRVETTSPSGSATLGHDTEAGEITLMERGITRTPAREGNGVILMEPGAVNMDLSDGLVTRGNEMPGATVEFTGRDADMSSLKELAARSIERYRHDVSACKSSRLAM